MCRLMASALILLFVGGVQDFVRNDQPPDRPSANDVRLDDFIHILRLNVPVPDCFRVNHDGGSEFALIEASGFIRAHHFDSALRQAGFE